MASGKTTKEDTRNAHTEAAAEWVAIDSLHPWDKNPRKNDGEPVRRVMESIKRFGFSSPIVARAQDRTIIAGHTRWKAAQALGMTQVPVRFLALDPAEARLLALADNRLNELTEWNDELLQEVLSSVSLEDAALAGWSQRDIEKMATDLMKGANDAPDDFDEFDTDLETEYCCPKCGYRWSGKPA